MFNISQIQACFSKLVGFNQPNDLSYPTVEVSLNTPVTGMFVNHPLCSIENLFNAGPEFAGFAANNTNEKVATAFNNYLRNIYKKSCTALVAKLLEVKKINDNAKSLIENQQLYTGFGFIGDKIIKKSRFVGYQIDTAKMSNIMVMISKIGFQVDEVQDVKFYLYHTSQSIAVKEITMTIGRASSFSWTDDLSDVLLSYMNGASNAGGFYVFGYYEDDIEGQVISMDKTLQNAPCASCSYADINAFNAWNRFVGLRAIQVTETNINDDRSLFDIAKIEYVNNTNWGMNLSITTACDLTQFFCSNRNAFTDALSKQITLSIINEIAYSTRLNSISDKTKGLAMADLDVESKSSFINFEYEKAIKALNVDFTGFDSNCLPCRRNSGITYSSL